MSETSQSDDAAIIQAAYADRVTEAFKVFAENLGMGQAPKASQERFQRAIELTRRARDMALAALAEVDAAPPHASAAAGAAEAGEAKPAAKPAEANLTDALSPEDQALIQMVLDGTSGQPAKR
jgi:hypothetical protein